MRLVINGWFWDQPHTGSGQYLRGLLPALLALAPDLEVTLIAPRPLPDAPESVRVKVAAPRRRGHLGKLWFEQHIFPAACRAARADLAHVPYWAPPLRAPVPFVVTVHDLIPLVLPEYRGGLLARLYTALVCAATPGAALAFTDSEAARADILAHIDIPAARVQTVYLAAGPAFKATGDKEADERVREKYNLPEKFVLYLGGFDVRKNLQTLLRAYTYVHKGLGDSVPLVLAGKVLDEGTARFPALGPLVEELALTDCVRFTGWVDEAEKPALMRLAACFVWPAYYEGFGLPPLEAMACGTPVVSVDASSIPEVVGDAAYLVAPDNARGMAGGIIAILTEEPLARTLRERGLAQAAHFSWERAARQTLAGYVQVLEE
ncbi:MAG: glycosyltransferase family 4 protein [Anaerolineae bacterium]|nr:glycosyltransferase family 4 protein [Anaerolineae bacterium]